MGLFNPRTVKQALVSSPAPTVIQKDIARLWAESIRNHSIHGQNESQIESVFHAKILAGLFGYRAFDGTTDFTFRPKQPMAKGEADVVLGHFGKDSTTILAPLELKGTDTPDLDAPVKGKSESTVQQAWRYANAISGIKWVLASNMLEIRLYAFGEGQQDYERIDLAKIDQPEELAKAQLLLSAESLLGTRLGDLLRQSKQADKELSSQLYADYSALRVTLIDAVNAATGGADKVRAVNTAQKILDRVLFVAFAEDRGLLPPKQLEKAFETQNDFDPQPVWRNFKGLFRAIDEGSKKLEISKYNGGLFKFDEQVDTLELSDDICKSFHEIGKYHFDTEVNITVLGHIFEQSVSDVEKLLAKARGEVDDQPEKTSGVKGRRKRDGIVYTPDYIAKFIVEKTLGTHVEDVFRTTMAKFAKGDVTDYTSLKFKKGEEERAWIAYRLALKNLRVVDPACGSGVFLVTAFDYLKAEYDRVNKKVSELRGTAGQVDIEDVDREILSQNLYGVDVNAESVEITKLSLWLKTAKKGKELDSLDHNIRVGDSLIEDSNFAYLKHGFSWNSAFPEVFAAGGFDVALGNPPYVRSEKFKSLKPHLNGKYDVYHGEANLYAYFFERAKRLLKSGGTVGYISSSTFMKTEWGQVLRDYLLSELLLTKIVDFGIQQVFEDVTTYTAIYVLENIAPTSGHAIEVCRPDIELFASSPTIQEWVKFPAASLAGRQWALDGLAENSLWTRLVTGRSQISEVCGEPIYGIKTGCNGAFIVSSEQQRVFQISEPQCGVFLKPWIGGSEGARWLPEGNQDFVICIPKGATNQLAIQNGKLLGSGDAALIFMTAEFPKLMAHLSRFKQKLETRSDQGDYWWELRSCDYYYLLEQGKIVTKDVARRTSSYLDVNGTYVDTTMSFFASGSYELLALLNSSVCYFHVKMSSSSFQGGFPRFKTQYLRTLPVPNWTAEQRNLLSSAAQDATALSQQVRSNAVALARRIPDLCPPDRDPKLSAKLQEWWKLENFAAFRAEIKKVFKTEIPVKERSDWEDLFTTGKAEIEKLSADIKRNEDEINAIVYKLFDLTAEETDLLEESIAAK
jgi:Eco57I restriction-modification methylase/TaqI-like C-terminal specificity domain